MIGCTDLICIKIYSVQVGWQAGEFIKQHESHYLIIFSLIAHRAGVCRHSLTTVFQKVNKIRLPFCFCLFFCQGLSLYFSYSKTIRIYLDSCLNVSHESRVLLFYWKFKFTLWGISTLSRFSAQKKLLFIFSLTSQFKRHFIQLQFIIIDFRGKTTYIWTLLEQYSWDKDKIFLCSINHGIDIIIKRVLSNNIIFYYSMFRWLENIIHFVWH